MVTTHVLEYSQPYGDSVAKTLLFYTDTLKNTDINEFTTDATTHAVESRNATFNENYKKRVTITKNGDIHCIVELRNCEFFASFYDQIMPPSNIDINITIPSDDVIIHRTAADAAVDTIRNIWLCYDKLTLNPFDNEKFAKMLKTPSTVNYLKELIMINPGLRHKQYSYVIVNNILKPRH